MTVPLFRCRHRHRVYPNDLSASRILFEGHVTVAEGKERVIGAHADIAAGVELGPALTHEDVAGKDCLPTEAFHTEALTR